MQRFKGWWPVAAALTAAIGAFAAVDDDGGGGRREAIDGLPVAVPVEVIADAPLVHNASRLLSTDLAGQNGVSRVIGDGFGCDGDSPVRDIHLLLEDDLDAGVLSQLTGDARANLGISQAVGSVQIDGNGSRLEPQTSHVTLSNARGTLQLQLDGGACPTRNLGIADRAGGGLSGTGGLSLVEGTGAYRNATFTDGTWGLGTATAPGADNPWTLDLDGRVAVLRPGLQVEVLDTGWGNLGADYLSRTVSVRYRITNTGPGDSFGTVLTSTSGSTGVTALGPTPQPLGDLLAGDSVEVWVKYRLALVGPPCALLVLNCHFTSTLTVSLPDALDTPATTTRTVAVTAPDLPPPAEAIDVP